MDESLFYSKILKTGPGSSIQDLGRSTGSHWGVPASGVADAISALWVNHILKNDPNSAVIEITQPGFILEFEAHTCIAWAGAKAKIIFNGQILNTIQTLLVQPNDRLEIGSFEMGAKLYLGIQHGFFSPEVLGSRSFYPGITSQADLRKGDLISHRKLDGLPTPNFSLAKWSTNWFESEYLDFFPGPDFGLLSEIHQERLVTEPFTISALTSRMGIILEEALENNLPELPTNPVFPGFVQLTSGGKLILLGPDAQVTGGYPRIMILSDLSKAILAQKRPGEKIRFRKINF